MYTRVPISHHSEHWANIPYSEQRTRTKDDQNNKTGMVFTDPFTPPQISPTMATTVKPPIKNSGRLSLDQLWYLGWRVEIMATFKC